MQSQTSQTAAFLTLGCKLNFSETSEIARSFESRGYRRVKFSQKADVYVINTCSVTALAEKKCRQAIRRAIRQNSHAVVVLVGCYAQLRPENLSKIKGVDYILGTDDKFRLWHHAGELEKQAEPQIFVSQSDEIARFDRACSLGDRTRSFLKVQDGCNYGCSYCTIPAARGKSRSPQIESLVQQARLVAESGIKEIVLTGVNTGDFGRTTGETFPDLLKALAKVNGIERFRISSIEPNLLSHEVLDFVADSEKFLPHFHVPLQSGSNALLKAMRRRYTRELFAERMHWLRHKMPQAFIGIDVIVGFPGETQAHFNETFRFLESLDISFLHVFSYSDRPGTQSAQIVPKVPPAKIRARSADLHWLSQKKHIEFYEKNKGQTEKVLFEHKKGRTIRGFTRNYLKVQRAFSPELENQIVEVKLNKISLSEPHPYFVI